MWLRVTFFPPPLHLIVKEYPSDSMDVVNGVDNIVKVKLTFYWFWISVFGAPIIMLFLFLTFHIFFLTFLFFLFAMQLYQ